MNLISEKLESLNQVQNVKITRANQISNAQTFREKKISGAENLHISDIKVLQGEI
jgi:hypothetical protein